MIRRAEKRDIGRLNELLFQVQGVHAEGRPDIFKKGSKKYTTEELESILSDERTPVFVYEEDGIVRGYAFCIFQETAETKQVWHRKTLYIDDLCVDEKDRGKHIGKQLYDYVRGFAKQARCDSVTLNVWALNGAAAAFYRKMGMQPLKTTMESILPGGLESPDPGE